MYLILNTYDLYLNTLQEEFKMHKQNINKFPCYVYCFSEFPSLFYGSEHTLRKYKLYEIPLGDFLCL